MASNTQVGLKSPEIGSFQETSNGNGVRPGARPIRVLHVVNDLSIGGTEMMLYKLLSRTNRERFQPAVISLDGVAKLGDRIKQLGIPVFAMGLKPSGLRLLSLLRLGSHGAPGQTGLDSGLDGPRKSGGAIRGYVCSAARVSFLEHKAIALLSGP